MTQMNDELKKTKIKNKKPSCKIKSLFARRILNNNIKFQPMSTMRKIHKNIKCYNTKIRKSQRNKLNYYFQVKKKNIGRRMRCII